MLLGPICRAKSFNLRKFDARSSCIYYVNNDLTSITTPYSKSIITPSLSIISVTSRFTFHRNRLPLQFVKEKMDIASKRVPKSFSMTQYLSFKKGKWVPGYHAPVKKKFRKANHCLNPYVKVDPEICKEVGEYFEYILSTKSSTDPTENTVPNELIMKDISQIEKNQNEKRLKRKIASKDAKIEAKKAQKISINSSKKQKKGENLDHNIIYKNKGNNSNNNYHDDDDDD